MKYVLLLGLLLSFGCTSAPVVVREHQSVVIEDLTSNGCLIETYSENVRRGDLNIVCKGE